MTTPMVIPLILEKDNCVPMEAETIDSGFPFDDREEERGDDFRSQLDDIAKRHPEFAEHLGGFPFQSDTLGRRRPPRPSEQEFRRFTDRPFGSSRFEHFGFPFTRDPFDEDLHQQPAEQQQPPQQPPQEEEKPKPERSRKQNIQQSNTVDLGQKQEPVNDRNQRSMSAPPPDNRQRYVSSIHIPINRDGGMGDMGKAQSQPQQQQQQEKPVERVIPIHVEGRDEPVMPKNTGPSFSQPQSERAYAGQPPQSERIFGQRPSQFTQFVGRESPRQYTTGQQKAPQQQVPVQKVPPQPQQQQVPVEKPEEQVPPPPQEQPKSSNPIDIIQLIQRDVSELMGQVEKFEGMPRDKQYLYLDEMLTRNLIKLDNIDTQGQENIRQARKEAIKCIESCIGVLDAKAAANVPKEKQPTEEVKTEETEPEESQPEERMEESVPKSEEKVEAVAPTEEKMEVVEEKREQAVEETPKEEKPVSEAENKPVTDGEIKDVPVEESKTDLAGDDKKEEEKKVIK